MFGELHGRMNICSWPPSVEKTRPVSVEVDTVHLSQFKLMTPRKGKPEKSTGISLIVATISGFTHSPGLGPVDNYLSQTIIQAMQIMDRKAWTVLS